MNKLPMGALIMGSDMPWTFGVGCAEYNYTETGARCIKVYSDRCRLIKWERYGVTKLPHIIGWYGVVDGIAG